MKPAYSLAIDISNYAGYLRPETIEAWKAAGVKRVIVRASTESEAKKAITRQQCQICAEAGFNLHAYGWLYWSEPTAEQVKAQCELLEGFPVKTLWLDCEDASIWEPEAMIDRIKEAVHACHANQLEPAIYTRRGWWERFTGNTEEFAMLPLWDCDLDSPPGLEPFEPYGGWDDRAMRQYQFDAPLGGVNCDLNCYVDYSK